MSVTVSFQPTGPVPGNAGPVIMRGASLTIGRGPANDLVLPDPDRMLSKSHCVIEDQGGNVVVIDLSTNGTFLNYGKQALGPVPTPLSDGDVLTLGLFELLVSISADAPSALDLPPDPLGHAPVSHGMADRAPDPLDLLDAPGPEGDVLDDLLGGGAAPTGPSQLRPVDPIDELLSPDGSDEDDPFFDRPSDGREGEGASFGAHNTAGSDSFSAQTPARSIIPDDWDDLLGPGPGENPGEGAGDGSGAGSGGGAIDPSGPGGAGAPIPDDFDAPIPDRPDPPVRDGSNAPVPDGSDAPGPDVSQAAIPEDPFAEFDPPPTAPTPPAPPPRPAAGLPVPPQPGAPASAAPQSRQDTPPAPSGTNSTEATDAFFRALGVTDMQIRDADLPETMERAGALMQVLIAGIREILMTRTSIKSEFRIEQTMIAAGGNNPLKFSVSPEQAVESLLRPRGRGYMGSQEAAQQALDDIAAHEIAMVAGMETAIKSVLARLSPEVLADRIETSGRLGGLLRGRKAQYWDIYEKMFAEISDQAENDFHHFFSREFAKAYQDQLNRLKTKDDQ